MTVTAPSKSLILKLKINDFEDAKSMTRERGHVGGYCGTCRIQ